MAFNISSPQYQRVKSLLLTNPNELGDSTVVPDPIGGPPDDIMPQSNALRNNTLLLIEVTPCNPKFSLDGGVDLFTMEPALGEYKGVLTDHGFQLASGATSVNLSVQAENFPSDSFTNDYGESFINQILNIGGAAFGELAQITDSKTGTEALGKFGKGLEGMGAGGIGGTMRGTASSIENWINTNKQQKGVVGTMAGAANDLIAGARIDFPNIWKNSSYSPTFSCTCRLYNPSPGNDDATQKYILAPLAAILSLGLPRMKEETSYGYQWPFMCQVKCRGLFDIKAGAISNITVVKGGEQLSLAYNQRLGMVDVRIDFVNLHSVLVCSPSSQITANRPTLDGYLKNLIDKHDLEKIDSGSSSLTKGIMTAISAAQFVSAVTSSGASLPRVPVGDIAKATALKIANPLF